MIKNSFGCVYVKLGVSGNNENEFRLVLSLSTSMTSWSTNFSTALAGSSMSDIFPEQLLRVGLCHTYTCLAEIKKSDRRTCSNNIHNLKMYRESYKRNTLIKKQPDYLLRVRSRSANWKPFPCSGWRREENRPSRPRQLGLRRKF